MDLRGAVAIITGGASGLGEATARHFLAAEASIVIADNDVAKGQALSGELGAQAVSAQCDVRKSEEVKRVVDVAIERYGRVDILVNCAGVADASRTITKSAPHDMTLFRKVIDINLVGTFEMLSQVVWAMSRNEPGESGERGVVINTASVAAFDGQIGQAAYSASKAGVAGMTLPIARDLSVVGIRVCAIAPGLFKTPLLSTLSEETVQKLGEAIPYPKRLGDPQEFALLAEHIVRNTYLNGAVIRLDGALRMGPK